MTQAKTGDIVRIHYIGRLTDGTEFDSSSGGEPLEFTLGTGQVIRGLDEHLQGMEEGDRSTVTIPSDDAYGPHRPDAVQTVERASIPSEVELAVGAQLQARTRDGTIVPLVVTGFDASTVELDANHPLAGKDLVFDVELVQIVKAA
ncbi:peptidylprolyl isomerase [Devosia geojensis]|uniref:Peptidyl-prolyl cis-trans isomerase n=1 Tax=Devosia geojensis TaxID=443610 RepID=A0A0F5FPD6_9HYPH|nr:peptidylprolyl isomerase [Devosia geojensis]KKB10706.1 peptidylprolyl isomerase [Devosia geojensis]